MKTNILDGLTLEYAPAEQEMAGWIASACRNALPAITEQWGLRAPGDCHFFIMTDPVQFFFQSAPWAWKLLLVVGFPFWYGRAKQTWPISAAWTQRYGRRVVIGIKPPRLWQQSDTSIGRMIFTEEKDTERKVRHLACHELVHACAAQLVLPAWLNEGLAALTVERFMQAPIFRADTRERVRDYQPKEAPLSYRQLARQGKEAIAYASVRGYWLVRYLEEKHPGFLKQRFAAPHEMFSFEDEMIKILKMDPTTFWQDIDALITVQ